ncbi:hypothetical protein [Propionibacterium australiense]|uniref:hypothetical protein n=1 Tax=Propionibacterium australiense TaxID=119981 RepID=UPI0011C3CB90|nr:hypothetical protein [Propionibacterium australiense]
MIDAVQFLEKLRNDIKKPGGYVEISRNPCDYPCLCLSYANGIAALQAFSNPETSLILEGSGLLEPTEIVELPALDELTSFTGNFIQDAEAVLEAVAGYLESFELDSIGEWYTL